MRGALAWMLTGAVLASCAAPPAEILETPDPVTVSISPEAPKTLDDLTVSVAESDRDLQFWWFRDDEFQVSGTDVGSVFTARDQVWRVDVYDVDTLVGSTSVTIGNTPPELSIEMPDEVLETQDVVASLVATDVDGDEVVVTWDWWRNGGAADNEELALAASDLTVDDQWTLNVSASDGDILTEASASVMVKEYIPPGTSLFDPADLKGIRLTLWAGSRQALTVQPTEWVRADIEIDGVLLEEVGIRLKGGGSFQPIDEKPSFKVNLDKYVSGQEFDGLDELVLNNMVMDPAQMSERLAYDIYRQAGVPAPRAVHVAVWLDEERLGGYTMVEEIDGRFLKEAFGNNDGPLYELFDVDFIAEDVPFFDHDGGADDRAALYQLVEVLDSDEMTLTDEGADIIDLEAWTRFWAVNAVIAQLDGYPYSDPGDDMYIYVDESDGKIRFIPHGADESFQVPLRPVDFVFGRLAETCLAEGPCREMWLEDVWEVMDLIEQLPATDMVAEIDDQTRSSMQLDPRMPYTFNEMTTARDGLVTFMNNRRADLQSMPGLD